MTPRVLADSLAISSAAVSMRWSALWASAISALRSRSSAVKAWVSEMAVVEKQFSQYTEAEKDGFAYRGGKDIIYKIGTEKNEFPVLIPNPEYWNRNLPRSAIQFITIEIPDDATIKQKLEKTLKNNDGYYYVYKLFSELDLNSLLPVIDK